MPYLQWVLSGLVDLIVSQAVAHKADIMALLSTFIDTLLTKLKQTGNADVAHKIQSVASSHVD